MTTPSRARRTETLLNEVRACTHCAASLPEEPRPILQASASSKILLASQAPGRLAHASGLPFDDPSGDRLRSWLGVDRDTFYDPDNFAIIPMGFCFPGTGNSGDLPPRPECAPLWRERLLGALPEVATTIAIGGHAQAWHLPPKRPVTEVVAAWREHFPTVVPLPHPSPRNLAFFKRHPEVEAELVPALRARVAELLGS